MFQFWGKILVFWARSLKFILNIYSTLIHPKSKKIWKNPLFFSVFGQKTKKLSFKIWTWFSKRVNSRKTLKFLAPTWWNQLSLRVTTYTQTFRGVHLPKMTKKHFKVGKKESQNFAFLDPLGRLVTLRPNALSYMPEILHASPYLLGAYSCQISAFKSNNNYEFFAKQA